MREFARRTIIASRASTHEPAKPLVYAAYSSALQLFMIKFLQVASGLAFGKAATIEAPPGLYDVELQAGGATVLKRKMNVLSSVRDIDIG